MRSIATLQSAASEMELKNSQDALRASEYVNRQLVQNLAAAVYTCDANGYITWYNKAAVELWGRKPVVGKDLWCGSWRIYRPEDGSMMSLDECPMAKALKGGKSVRGEEIIVERPDGVRHHILPHPDPIFDENGNVIGAFNMLVDITNLKKKEDALRHSEEQLKLLAKQLEQRVEDRTTELQQANAILSSKNKELEQFAFIASHDMQEPLRKITTYTSRLEKCTGDILDQTSQTYLGKIRDSSLRMMALLNDILNYSRLGYTDQEFVQTDLNTTLKNVLSDFEVMIEDKHAVIRIGALPVVPAIPLQMNQLFHNLVSNSLKFCNTQEPCQLSMTSRTLTGREVSDRHLEEERPYCEILIKDNGIGFRQEFAETIFNIFRRLNSRDKYEGSGIGLAICRKIAMVHKGEIYADSAADKGTTIHVILPLRR
jgi:PAS domain S-box-containing protein